MKIDLDWIQKELDAERKVELECVDVTGFLKDIDISEANEKILDQGLLVVDYIYSDGDIRLVGHIDDLYFNTIASEEFKYFRIKQAPTFKDLVSVAVKAYEDGFISHLELYDGGLSSIAVECADDSSGEVIERAIEKINSLYTETFIIESEDHIGMVKLKASVRLTNGNEFIVDNATNEFLTSSTSFEKLTILTLKGAIVTQKRS